MPRNQKPIYQVAVELKVEVLVSIVADNVQEAVNLAARYNGKDLIRPVDDSVDLQEWENVGVKSVSADGYVPFKQ